MFDLHRHDEYSTFDGYGKATELAAYAKELGYTSLCTTNHGNTNGLIQTYDACKQLDMKPILGVEGYCLPVYKEKTRGYHLIVIAKDLKGYGNMNRLQYEADKQKYYNPIWTLDLLRKYHEGLICTSACVASYSSQAIIKGNIKAAEKFLAKLYGIFGEDFYVEIQPYKISDPGVQERVNVELIKLSLKNHWNMILTSDSHRGRREDLPSYIKMHEIAGHDISHIEDTYSERYMPAPDELGKRFIKMHEKDFGLKRCKQLVKHMYRNLDDIEEKCEKYYLDELPLVLPDMSKEGKSASDVLTSNVMAGLRRRGKTSDEYMQRCRDELEIIIYHGFDDYFLMVADYVNWAKEQGISVGPGRGSVCNSLVAYALGITEVDSLYFDLDFRRFLRKDKTAIPDIDIDFETSRRHEVIEYLCNKYEGHAARICSYGLYKVDNLLNDLAKACGVVVLDEDGDEKPDKQALAAIKRLANSYIGDSAEIDVEGLLSDPQAVSYNEEYDNIFTHFCHLYKKVRFIGTHAAGVAITGGKILDYCALRTDKAGDVFTSYDLEDIESINVIKFDILGLKTMESIGDLRRSTGVTIDYAEVARNKQVMEAFGNGQTDGVFQFERGAAREILKKINADCFDDVTAASAMNRPGPLSLKQPDLYAQNKVDPESAKSSIYWDYTSESYGTIIYQEQVQRICVGIGSMEWTDADKVMKMMKGGHMTESAQRLYNELRSDMWKKFVEGAVSNGYSEDDARDLFGKMTTYTFNKGHATGYSLISIEEMYYKVYFPNEYWFSKLKYAKDDSEVSKFQSLAVKDGSVILLPHIQWSDPKAKLKRLDDDNAILMGLTSIKGVGEKAAMEIVRERADHGVFKNFDDFYDRCKHGPVNSRVVDLLIENGATEMNKKRYMKRVVKWNSSLYSR